MRNKKLIFAFLALLLFIKFAYQPWVSWLDEKQASSKQLASFYYKQQKAIDNEELLSSKLTEHKNYLTDFAKLLPPLGANEKANSLWFTLIESIKNNKIKIYNQKVEFEQIVTKDISYITGSLYISGKAEDVLTAVLVLEGKSPVVFLDQLKLNRPGGARKDNLVTQLYVGYWFSRIGG